MNNIPPTIKMGCKKDTFPAAQKYKTNPNPSAGMDLAYTIGVKG
jgi:hypothetical protein